MRVIFCFLFAMGLSQVCWGNELPRGLESREYQGWRESIYLNATERAIQVIVVPGVGGRIVHFSVNGTNILFENFASLGKTLFTGKDLWFGGYQCQLGPDSRSIPDESDYYSRVQRWQPNGDFSLKVSGTNDPAIGVSIEKEFVLAPDTGDLGLVQRIKNESTSGKSYSLRDRTVCKNAGFVLMPLNPKSRFKHGWCYCYQYQTNWVYDGEPPRISQAQVMDGVLVVESRGVPARLGADSDAGWIAYVREKTLFIKYFPVFKQAEYTDGGNTIFASFDQSVMQFGPVSPEFKLAPGGEAVFPEKWVLVELDKAVTTPQQARKLVKRIRAGSF